MENPLLGIQEFDQSSLPPDLPNKPDLEQYLASLSLRSKEEMASNVDERDAKKIKTVSEAFICVNSQGSVYA